MKRAKKYAYLHRHTREIQFNPVTTDTLTLVGKRQLLPIVIIDHCFKQWNGILDAIDITITELCLNSKETCNSFGLASTIPKRLARYLSKPNTIHLVEVFFSGTTQFP